MSVKTIGLEYKGEVRDRVENFNGDQLVYVGWDNHLMFCAAFTFLVSPDALFSTLIDEVIVDAFSVHPEWNSIDWPKVIWLLNDNKIQPKYNVSLKDQGIDHKSLLRIQTPELKGFQGAGV